MTVSKSMIALLMGAFCILSLPVAFAQTPETTTTTTKQTPTTTKPAIVTPDWTALQASYKSDATVTPKVTSVDKPDADAHIEHLVFTDAKGQTVTGLFLRPKIEGVYPVALVLHGLGSSKDDFATFFAKPMVARGVACLLLDAPLHGERQVKDNTPSAQNPIAFLSTVHDGVIDYREVLNYLTKERKDVDTKRIGLFGYSMGSMMGAILTSVDDRITAASLCVGGDPIKPLLTLVPEPMMPLAQSACPSNYIGHISPRPVFMINASEDKTMPEAASKLMQGAAQEPKTIVWVKGGHILPPADAQKAVDWLLERLLPTKTVVTPASVK